MNRRVNRDGKSYRRLPPARRANIVCANIVCGNTLRLDWAEVLPPGKCSYKIHAPEQCIE
jgi:hypothetical protein